MAGMGLLKRMCLAALITPLFSAVALPARADVGFWPSFETRIPIFDDHDPLLFPRTFRFYTEARYTDADFPGIGSVLLRYGPIWKLHPNLTMALNMTSAVSKRATTDYDQDARFEAEPNFFVRLGPMSLNNRSRLAHHWKSDGTALRFRNQMRLGYHPEGATWFPFIGDEVFLDLGGQGLIENRAVLGIGVSPAEGFQVSTSLVGRSYAVAGGEWHHGLLVTCAVLYSPKQHAVFELDGDAD